jgi:DNA-binding transcriptional ArsR family regulator
VFSERKQGSTQTPFFLTGDLSLKLEDVFCSKTRMRVLKLLFQLGQLNTTDLADRLRVNYATTLRHLIPLKKEDVVEERVSGRTRFFRFKNSLRAQTVTMLLEKWESQ